MSVAATWTNNPVLAHLHRASRLEIKLFEQLITYQVTKGINPWTVWVNTIMKVPLETPVTDHGFPDIPEETDQSLMQAFSKLSRSELHSKRKGDNQKKAKLLAEAVRYCRHIFGEAMSDDVVRVLMFNHNLPYDRLASIWKDIPAEELVDAAASIVRFVMSAAVDQLTCHSCVRTTIAQASAPQSYETSNLSRLLHGWFSSAFNVEQWAKGQFIPPFNLTKATFTSEEGVCQERDRCIVDTVFAEVCKEMQMDHATAMSLVRMSPYTYAKLWMPTTEDRRGVQLIHKIIQRTRKDYARGFGFYGRVWDEVAGFLDGGAVHSRPDVNKGTSVAAVFKDRFEALEKRQKDKGFYDPHDVDELFPNHAVTWVIGTGMRAYYAPTEGSRKDVAEIDEDD